MWQFVYVLKDKFLSVLLLQIQEKASVLVCEHKQVSSYMCVHSTEGRNSTREADRFNVFLCVQVKVFALGKFTS